MECILFVLQACALLLSPGPTNTMVAVVGSQRGWQGIIRVAPVELLGYTTTILPLALFGSIAIHANPYVATAIKSAAAFWILVIAIKVWKTVPAGSPKHNIRLTDIYLTTVFNPKSLVFAFAILPSWSDYDFPPKAMLLSICIVVTSFMWFTFGITLASLGDGSSFIRGFKRFAAIWLSMISISLAYNTAIHSLYA